MVSRISEFSTWSALGCTVRWSLASMEPDCSCEEVNFFLWPMCTLHFILKHASIIFGEINLYQGFCFVQWLCYTIFSIWYCSDRALLTKQCSKNWDSVLTFKEISGCTILHYFCQPFTFSVFLNIPSDRFVVIFS